MSSGGRTGTGGSSTGGSNTGGSGPGGGGAIGSGGAGTGGVAPGTEAGVDGGNILSLRVTETKLVADQAGVAAKMDPNLVNAWGLAINPNAPGGPFFWIADNHSGVASVYDGTGTIIPVVVTIPFAGDSGTGSPTGQVFNESADFMGDKFIFDSEDGIISGWAAGGSATVRSDHSPSGAIYKGLAIVTGTTPRLYAANFHAGTVDVLDTAYNPVTKAGAFTDPQLPAGFAPFNVAVLGGSVLVTYAKQDANKEDDTKALGNGFVNVFTEDGTFTKRLISRGVLNSPWGMAMAPVGFGTLAGTLLVGNFGDGTIHAFDPNTGELMGQLTDAAGPIAIAGLWALVFGPASDAQDLSRTLFFTAGPADETHGVFGKLALTP